MPKILIFSQDTNLSRNLHDLLINNSYEVAVFAESNEAIEAIREEFFDAVFIDLPSNNSVNHELLTSIKCFHDLLPIIVITESNRIAVAHKGIKNGATNYITKPINSSALLLTLKLVISDAALRIENLLYKRSLEGSECDDFILEPSEAMIKIYTLIEKIAKTDSPIMITGEIGTGKETVARRIHNRSLRSDFGFCKIDCATLPVNLQESELFGYTREGEDMEGIFQRFNGGTVFLDNIEALPISTQVKLLYLMQNKKIQLIGSTKIVNINIRLLAGSLNELKEDTMSGNFFESLYQRLNTIKINLPPLRERREDIPNLVEHFLDCLSCHNSLRVQISSPALVVLCEYDWPGNTEQLKNLLQRLITASETGEIICDDLPAELSAKKEPDVEWNKIVDNKLDDIAPLKQYLQMQERSYLQKVLERSGGDKNLAAKKLGISLASFYRKWNESML